MGVVQMPRPLPLDIVQPHLRGTSPPHVDLPALAHRTWLVPSTSVSYWVSSTILMAARDRFVHAHTCIHSLTWSHTQHNYWTVYCHDTHNAQTHTLMTLYTLHYTCTHTLHCTHTHTHTTLHTHTYTCTHAHACGPQRSMSQKWKCGHWWCLTYKKGRWDT